MKKFWTIFILILMFFFAGASTSAEASDSPVIIGPNLIQKEQYQVLTLSDILNLYTSEIGGVSITRDTYTGNGAILGTYEIDLMAADGVEIAEKTIEIEVLRIIGYSVRAVTDKKNIHISKAVRLMAIDVAQIHSATGVFELNNTSQMSVLTDNYSAKFDTPGNYLFEYRVMDATGLDMTISATITVYESDRIDAPIFIAPEKPSIFSNISKITNMIITVVLLGVVGFGIFKLFKVGRKAK